MKVSEKTNRIIIPRLELESVRRKRAVLLHLQMTLHQLQENLCQDRGLAMLIGIISKHRNEKKHVPSQWSPAWPSDLRRLSPPLGGPSGGSDSEGKTE